MIGVGVKVDGVWGTGGMMFEEELVVIPFAFKSALFSLSSLSISEMLSNFSLLLSFHSSTCFLSFSKHSWAAEVSMAV